MLKNQIFFSFKIVYTNQESQECRHHWR